ncbi:hypothetical protein SteCoe_37221 [Stentor coeruleus]|uniref:Uncharacterized protein n=1 Tax=Stentor coeruleus TaxID=5963 RepID=A0A1R2ANF3_9CILI|nr:hypothetical protein SteCoe_37221 [Stentor coeruleus]
MISVFLVQLITLPYSESCFSPNQIDFTSYVVSSTYDWLVSPYYPSGTWAPITGNTGGWVSMPDAPFIWDSSGCVCTITITKSFFLPVLPSKVNLYIIVDDYVTATVNGGSSCYVTWNKKTLCDMTSSAVKGLNQLKLDATNIIGPGGLAYKLEAYLKLA